MATSNTLSDAPNNSIASSSHGKPGQCNTKPSMQAMTTAQSMAVWRAPSRPITRPANITADTAPTAAATSTSESAPSPKA
ncbi:MAG: hypothetical protein U5L73_06995 [Rhodoferax sp.]|uniref:hypothetical protein n=1 Tax=Rhodoferax sp. TaxID=50421 RepID=UPI002ACE8DA5|nr:hypothetical protein [Rhodoferax sp.]MDZ7891491.1 hypothetical protein [Rhodoferax sp.]